MKPIDAQMAEDLALRDAAKRLLDADIAYIREDVAQRGPGARIACRIGDAALDTFDDATAWGNEHRSLLLGVATVAVAWFARKPLMHGAEFLAEKAEDTFG
ncbi:hypothetical protein V5740_04170 [Croceibacterium sp. TMG7-5b_MA50]|uniref:hypothetical protein n=1 Tax=Croceibacterium sp. TMG7-5b_MA50 TaxID=3121290 RepID=UPI003221A72C